MCICKEHIYMILPMCVCLQEQNIYTFTTVQIQMHIGRRKRREMEMIPKGHTNRLVVLLIAVTVG